MTTIKGGTSGRVITTAAGTSGRTTELRGGVNGSVVSADAGINGYVVDVQGGVNGRVYTVDAPPVELASNLIPPAPSFEGVKFAQFIPANLVHSGTLSIGDPIDSLPLYGDLIPSGAFTASGTARPTMGEDHAGRLCALFNGSTTMPTIEGLDLDLSSGISILTVERMTNYNVYAGLCRMDAGSDLANNSVYELYTNAQNNGDPNVTNRLSVTNRFPGPSSVAQHYGMRERTLISVDALHGPDNSMDGVYKDGVIVGPGGLVGPSTNVQRIQIAGYNRGKFNGEVHMWLLYDRQLTAAQYAEVREYVDTYFIAPPITEMPVFDGVEIYAWERETATGSGDLTSWPGTGGTLDPLVGKEPALAAQSVNFNGSTDVIKSTTSINWTSTYHAFVVCSNGNAAAGGSNVILSSEASNNAVRMYYNRGGVKIDCTIWLNTGAVVVPSSTYAGDGEHSPGLFEIDVDADFARMITDGVAGSDVALAAPARDTDQVLHVGARTDSALNPAALEARAIVLCMGDITPEQISQMRKYLNGKHLRVW